MGPSGTAVLPRDLPPLPSSGWRLAVKTAVALLLVVLVILCFAVLVIAARVHHAERRMRALQNTSHPSPVSMNHPASAEPIEAPAPAHLIFGPVNEFDLQAGTHQFLDLDKQQLLTHSGEMVSVLYGNWLNESGADLLYAEEEKIIAFDGIYSAADGNASTNLDAWDELTPEQVKAKVENTTTPQSHVQKPSGPIVNLLTRYPSATWFFKTREGAEGLLQIVSFTNEPASAKIRYKLIQNGNGEQIAAPTAVDNTSDETLADRLQAASMLNDFTAKDDALRKLAQDAAEAGNAKVAGEALQKMVDFTKRSETGLSVVRALAKHGMRKPAIEIARTISDFTIRDQALSELAGK